MTALRVALGEYDLGWQDPGESVERAGALIAASAAEGARVVVLPEMFLTGFTMDPAAHAETVPGTHTCLLGRVAAKSGVQLLGSVSRRETAGGAERFLNSVVHVGDDGEPRVVYDKQRLFAYGGEHELYTAGSGPPRVLEIEGVRLATLVCYDLRFPELFREIAQQVDMIAVVANWPAARRPHWDVLLQARAIENQCWIVGVNRAGQGGRIEYDGGSAAYDPWGERADVKVRGARVVDVDPARVQEIRSRYPFLRDRKN